MKRLSRSITALALSTVLAISSIAPAGAVPLPQPQVKASGDVENVRMIRRHHHARGYRHMGQNNRAWRGHSGRYAHYGRYGRHGRNYYWRGHRGYAYYRPGYRFYNGYWFPAAAFTAGVVVGTTAYRSGNYHVRWCRERYISYRVSDDTYQPYHGPRRPCISP